MDDHEDLLTNILGVVSVDAEAPQRSPGEGRMIDEELLERRHAGPASNVPARRIDAR